MTATQSLKVYEVLNKHFNNKEDAKIVVEQIEQIIEEKIEAKKDIFLTKDDKIELINKIDTNFKWLVGILITLFGIVIGLLLKMMH
jgi:hypothetical protein